MTMSSRPKATRVLPFTVLAVLAAVLLAPAVRAQTAPWTVVPSPDASPGNNQLDAVATITATDVWAVGAAENAIGNNQPLAEHWDGTSWSIVPTPSVEVGNLLGVAAVSSTDVWAAGSLLLSSRGNTASFIHWNGRKWTVAKSGVVANSTIFGITAVASNDLWAVGEVENQTTFNEQTLIEHWNGKTWSVVASPNATGQFSILNGVTAVSASDIWAVGRFEDASNTVHTLTEHWDGTAWSIVASPDGVGFESELNSATALSASDVWAVGDSAGSGTLTEQWNGTTWSVVASPSVATNSSLTGVAAVTASDIWATGITFTSSSVFQAFIEQWNGTSWSIVPSPNPGSASFLSGAAADPVSGQAWAVGNFTPAAGSAQQTLTEFNP